MPVAFACACGKSFRVSDGYAGKQTKCPACGAGLVVPTPQTGAAGDGQPPGEFEVVEDAAPLAGGKKPAVKAALAEDDADEPPRPKKRKKKKKRDTGIDREQWAAEEEERRYREYATRRLVYMIAGASTVVISLGALLIFARNGMTGIIPMAVVGAGVLGGAYCVWQGLSGTFHKE